LSAGTEKNILLPVNAPDFQERLRTARSLMQVENHAEALRVYDDLALKFPREPLLGEYARAATIYGDFDLAERLWEKIRCSQPNTGELLSRLAFEYQQIRMHNRARELYRMAAKIEPENIEVELGLAWVLARANSVEEARATVNKCIELDPRGEKPRYLSAHLDRLENKFDSAEQQFRDLLASHPQDLYIRYGCHAELAHIYDRTERFEEAMAQLVKGKRLGPQNSNQESERCQIDVWHDDILAKVRALPKNILAQWGENFPARLRKPATSLTLLTGSARSGTTLLERVLDAHPNVVAADESLAFTRVMPLIDITASSVAAPRLTGLRQRYLNMLMKSSGRPGSGKILLDKNPSRTIWLASFLRAFPELRVILALRDPRDIVVSLYFQNQTTTNFLPLEMLAQYYVKVMDLWLAIREWEGFEWIETRYEDMVADLPGQGARVTKFLGLEWQESQSRFNERNQQKPVMSTNYSAVSQPLYARSVGRWRTYEKYLAPVLPMLGSHCKTFGYA
jgi:Flp pilus assembly protein TadD